MGIEGEPEPVDEGHRAAARRGPGARIVRAQALLHHEEGDRYAAVMKG